MKGFGKNLRTERINAGLTQAQLAQMIGVKQQQLSQWECDKVEPTLYNIVMILHALNISFEELLDNVDNMDS